MDIVENIRNELIRRKKKLGLAESCTGGAVAARITSVPDASLFFLGSIVAYSPGWKEQFLQVSRKTLEEKSSESAEVVREMVVGLFAETEVDYAVAVSGFAGPGGGRSRGWSLWQWGSGEALLKRSGWSFRGIEVR